MLELEQELVEFQESSRELEQALEDELRELENRNALLLAQSQLKDEKISKLNDTITQLTAEWNHQLQAAADKEAAQEKLITELKQKLVHMEILNDDMMSNDRVLESKYQMATQFNNELIEKIALVENDLELERQANALNRLTISNLKNEIAAAQTSLKVHALKHLSNGGSRLQRDSTYHDFSFAEGTILDIEEMLASEPPKYMKRSTSTSLTRFHDLYSRSSALRQKVGEVNTSLALKSPSTTQLTKRNTSSEPPSPIIGTLADNSLSKENSTQFGVDGEDSQNNGQNKGVNGQSNGVNGQNNRVNGQNIGLKIGVDKIQNDGLKNYCHEDAGHTNIYRKATFKGLMKGVFRV